MPCQSIMNINKTKRLIDTIASNNGYRRNSVEPYSNWLTYLLSYPQSRDAIASKKRGRRVFPVAKVLKILPSKNPIFGDFQLSFGGT